LLGGNPTRFAGVDHGFGAAVVRGERRQGPRDAALQSPEQPANCRAAATTNLAKACWAGGTAQIYVNLAGRDPRRHGSRARPYETVRNQIISGVPEPDRSRRNRASRSCSKIMKKEETAERRRIGLTTPVAQW
jgi:hypothetical protein